MDSPNKVAATTVTATAMPASSPSTASAQIHYTRDEHGQWQRVEPGIEAGAHTDWYISRPIFIAGLLVAAAVTLFVWRKAEADLNK